MAYDLSVVSRATPCSHGSDLSRPRAECRSVVNACSSNTDPTKPFRLKGKQGISPVADLGAMVFTSEVGPLSTEAIVEQAASRIANDFKDSRRLQHWHRYDTTVGNFRTSLKDGPEWKDVRYRATCRLHGSGDILLQSTEMMARNRLHERLPWGQSSICTVLFYEGSSDDTTGARLTNGIAFRR